MLPVQLMRATRRTQLSLGSKLRNSEGPFWRSLKWCAKQCLALHIPVFGPTRLFFRLMYRLHVMARETVSWSFRFFWGEPLFRSLCTSIGPGLQMERLPYIQGKGRIVLGARVRLSGRSSIGFTTRYTGEPEFVLGDGTFIGHDCSFHIGSSVRIGKHCLIAGGVRVFDLDGHPLDADRRQAGEPTPPEAVRPVVIGDNVWIGTGAIILKGVKVGDRSIIGAGSVVTGDVPPDTVVAGNPARVVKCLSGENRPSGTRWTERSTLSG